MQLENIGMLTSMVTGGVLVLFGVILGESIARYQINKKKITIPRIKDKREKRKGKNNG